MKPWENIRRKSTADTRSDGQNKQALRRWQEELERRVYERTATLAESEARYRLIVETAHEGIWQTDAEGRTTYTNSAMAAMLGYTQEEMQGRLLFDFMDGHVRPEARRLFRERRHGTSTQHDFRFRRKDGRDLWTIVTASALQDEQGKFIGALGLLTDITSRKQAEQNYARQQQLLESVMQTTDVMLALLDPQFDFVWVNEAYAKTCGMRPAEMVGKNHFALYAHAENEAIFRRVRNTGEGVFYKDKPFKFPDQPERGVTYWDWSLAPTKDAEGKVISLVLSLRETTKFKQAEDALRASEQRYRLAVDFTYDWEFWLNPQGEFVYCSPSCEKITGRKADKLLSVDGLHGLVHPEDLPRYDRHIRECELRRKPGEGEWRIRHTDGTYRWVAHACQPVFDEHRQYLGVRGSNREITDRKETEAALKKLNETLEQRIAERTAALQASEERFRQMAENVREVFWLADADLSQMHYVSPAFETIWGQPCERLYKNPRAWIEAIHPEDQERVRRMFLRDRTSGDILQGEYRIVRPDGTCRWIADRGCALRDKSGRVYRIAGVARDVTEEKRLQSEVERVSEMERQRLGRDLHDGLSQHLAAMSMLGDSLTRTLQSRLPAEAKQAARLANDARDAMTVAHDLARALYPTSLQISGLSTALKELTLLVVKLFPIRCQCRKSNGWRLADPNLERQLFRIAQEAVFNAAKHSRGRNIWIALRQSKQWLTLTVKDDGVGVPEARLVTSDMGLNIMRYRANLIGALLTFDTRRGHGTTVTCKLRGPPP
ncbi:MAG: hypothetical protein PCFJNLEI_03383 [Verrucomicrobiae bacterium]|nr:hypothetical protein [Verrucomicrobiae bacterium]